MATRRVVTGNQPASLPTRGEYANSRRGSGSNSSPAIRSARLCVDAVGRMLADALQDVDEVVVGVDLVQSTGHDQALHDADVFGPEFGPAEQPIFGSSGNSYGRKGMTDIPKMVYLRAFSRTRARQGFSGLRGR